MIADTSFIIDLMKNNQSALAKAIELEKSGEPQLVTSLTIFELFSGLAMSNKPHQEKEEIFSILNKKTILPFDNKSAEKSGEIDGNLTKKGEKIGVVDSMIAGIAICRKEKVITRNLKDFSKVNGLNVETY